MSAEDGRRPVVARMTQHSAEQALIAPLLIWRDLPEDEWGDALPGEPVVADLRQVRYGGEEWVTTALGPYLMLRADVVNLSGYPWIYEPHTPEQMWYAHARPVAAKVEQPFRTHHIASLRAIGARVLPLVPGSVPAPSGAVHGHLVHAVMRGEDWIGFVMALKARGSDSSLLPDDLMVVTPPGSVES